MLLIDKPAGITSHDVVARVRRALGGAQGGPRGHARPVRDRAAARAGGARHQAQQQLMAAAQELRDDRPARRASRAPATPRGRSPQRRAARPTAAAADRRDPPASAAILGGEDRRRARLQAGAARGAVRAARADVTVYRFEQLWREDPVPGELARAAFAIECSAGTYVRSLIADSGTPTARSCDAPRSVRSRSPRRCPPPPRGQHWSRPPLIALADALELARGPVGASAAGAHPGARGEATSDGGPQYA